MIQNYLIIFSLNEQKDNMFTLWRFLFLLVTTLKDSNLWFFVKFELEHNEIDVIPTILFEASQFLPNQQRSGGELRGNLTLLGMTHPIILNIKLNKFAQYPFGHRKKTIGISANTVFDRSIWGMDYGVSNDMVGDKVLLRFEFEAIEE